MFAVFYIFCILRKSCAHTLQLAPLRRGGSVALCKGSRCVTWFREISLAALLTFTRGEKGSLDRSARPHDKQLNVIRWGGWLCGAGSFPCPVNVRAFSLNYIILVLFLSLLMLPVDEKWLFLHDYGIQEI